MRLIKAISTSLILALAACGRPAVPGQAGGELSAAERVALVRALSLAADSSGQVVNECGDKVTPAIVAAELGGAAGTAQLVAIGGGESMATCYGDGPDLHLMLGKGAAWREVYSARGRMLVILPTATAGVHDLADGGPGFSFPVWQWNGREYAPANREVSDAETANATILP